MRIARTGFQLTLGLLAAACGTISGISGALAARAGEAEPWQLGMQEMVTELGRSVSLFHDWLLLLITLISLFVLVLLLVVIFRFNERSNPAPSRTTHNTMLEVAWTIVPVLILIAIAIPSFRVLREQLIIPPHDIVVKATGHSWYWSYEYPQDQGGFSFDSNMVPETDLKPGQPRLLSADNELVAPVNKVVRLQVTSADVMHSFGVPSLGFTLDAIPGRLNEAWFRADREGVFYGQCRELCGNGHPYMPIQVRVVSEADYAAWLTQAKQKFAATAGDMKVAAAGN
jgi:cytochrome c oxidase subunit 2